MKSVVAIINPFRLDEVRDALAEIGVSGLTMHEVKGYGRQKGHSEHYRGVEHSIDFRNKIKIEVVVAAEVLEQVISAICAAARTGKVGDGKIFVYDVAQVIRIRTGEKDNDAL